ncbi:MAG: aminotransferase class V-fold PLP-dependent enzyme, partial [Lachnospiraceae bacterium]|nr:aminotransferase class V-fold PLP-dependent enzyme [Lachnospiraceae bacterium]
MSNLPPAGFEAGSPNIIAISSLNAALKWLNSVGINAIAKHKKQLMGKLISEVRSLGAATYLPYNLESHTSVLSINVEDYEPSSIGEILGSDYNIAVRTGFHCAPFVHRLIGTEESLGTVRISVGYFNTERDIDAVVNALGEIMEG